MADSSPSSSELPENESPAQKQARLRRERRNAKLQVGGNDRLNKIMNVSGRTAPAPESQFQTTQAPEAQFPPNPQSRSALQQPQQSFQTFDPDLSDPFNTPGDPNIDPMMRMMQQLLAQQPGQQTGQQNGPPVNPQEDPMKLLQQMMGGAQAQTEQQPPAPASAHLWRIVHATFALFLSLYVGLATPFTGTKIARAESQLVDDSLKGGMATKLFLLFATFELVLQSSRYFLEKGNLPSSGLLGSVTQFLPEPWAGYLRVAGRYSVIYTTIMADVMVVVFVLGVLAWWNETGT